LISRVGKAALLDSIVANVATIDSPANRVNPFASSAWLKLFVQEVIPDDARLALVDSKAEGHSVMYLWASREREEHLCSLANYYASLSSPVLSDSTKRLACAEGLARQLIQARPRVATLRLFPLASDDAEAEQLATVLSRSGWFIRKYVCFGNWTLPCEGLAFAEYMASRSAQLRHTHARKAKKFLAKGSLEVHTRPEEVERAMDAFESVYAKSWKPTESYPRFVRRWAQLCAASGWLRLGLARLDGVVVAAQFWFTIARRAYIFKLAHDEACANWSAGTVLTAHMFQHALDVDRVVEIDYLTGDDPYKKLWMTHRRERIGLTACNLATANGLVVAAREWAGAATSAWRARSRGQVETGHH
jgi:CelD/BcsL family acetyltransferase involved in cellulose biosynthesis